MTGRINRHGTIVDTIFVLMLFCVFAISVLFVLLSGAGVYRDTAEIINDRYEKRVCVSYLTSKLRHYDTEDGISVGKIGDTEALVLTENFLGEEYVTYIYFYNGYICELYTGARGDIKESMGEKIIPASGLAFSVNARLVSVELQYSDGSENVIYTYINSAGGIAK